MSLLYTDPAYDYPVYDRLVAHAQSKFSGEPINKWTVVQVEQYLTSIVPGSHWRIEFDSCAVNLMIKVKFDNEHDAIMYALRWA